jgi:hypothetical protein
VTEVHGDPVNQIPRFLNHPIGGPVYNNTPNVPWIAGAPTSAQAQAAAGGGRGAGGARGAAGAAAPATAAARGAGGPGGGAPAGFPGEASMYSNERDFVECIRSRNKPFCDLELGHRTAAICNLGNMSLRLGGRSIQWDPEKEVVIGDKEAAAMCAKQYRAPWDGILRSIIKV